MLKKTITYTDYNNTERKEDHYFNLTKAEIMEMELSITGGLAEMMVDLFLETEFEGGRHQRRIDKISAIENEQ